MLLPSMTSKRSTTVPVAGVSREGANEGRNRGCNDNAPVECDLDIPREHFGFGQAGGAAGMSRSRARELRGQEITTDGNEMHRIKLIRSATYS